MSKKQVSTSIDEDLYYKIKEKGYKISELIYYGYIYMENGEKSIYNKEYVDNLIKELEELSKDIKNLVRENLKNKLESILDLIEKEREKLVNKNIITKYDFIRSLDSIKDYIEDLIENL